MVESRYCGPGKCQITVAFTHVSQEKREGIKKVKERLIRSDSGSSRSFCADKNPLSSLRIVGIAAFLDLSAGSLLMRGKGERAHIHVVHEQQSPFTSFHLSEHERHRSAFRGEMHTLMDAYKC